LRPSNSPASVFSPKGWKEPTSQPQILEVDYRLPNRGFQD
jgi:hypothetical protein